MPFLYLLWLKFSSPPEFIGGGGAHGLYLQKKSIKSGSNEGTLMLKSISDNSEEEIEWNEKLHEKTYLGRSQGAPFYRQDSECILGISKFLVDWWNLTGYQILLEDQAKSHATCLFP